MVVTVLAGCDACQCRYRIYWPDCIVTRQQIAYTSSMTLRPVSLKDKYDLAIDEVYLTGTQALVRLCLMQAELDKRAGLNTAGYISGYRGSPLGAIDQQFSSASSFLESANVVFEPGLNEDLAATAVWGSQQAGMRGDGKYDGVFGMWYGKGPGVDRTGDAFRHANMAGSSAHGGVLVLMGDDHTCESSTTAHQSEFAMMDALIPVINPANVSEMVSLGLHGYAMSRFAGVWCGLKCVKDNVESTASIATSMDFAPVIPDFDTPEGGLNIRPNDNRHAQESRMHRFKLEAVKSYVRANRLNQSTLISTANAGTPRVGVVSTGKSYMDTRQALQELALDDATAAQLGLSLFKVAMPWPLEPEGIKEFAQGLDLLIVVEEKRSILEFQIKDILYGTADAPMVVGKHDEEGMVLLQAEGALNPMQIAEVIGSRLAKRTGNNALQTRVDDINEILNRDIDVLSVKRLPYFCAGCPHNSSTVVPEGSRAYAGIGCHWMVQMMERNTEGSTQMGGEGANWIGEAHFSNTPHVFQNIGDGTYNHSGLLAIRAAIASNTNITFKLLYNDAVAMTGGQGHEGDLSPYDIASEIQAAGAKRIVMVSDLPDALDRQQLPKGIAVHHRDELIPVQESLAAEPGVSVLIYEQTCAAEKRRRRKRGTMVDPPKRVYINPEVCEGCGDCGVQSNCVAILPLETELGRKRQIDQSACNKDFSCVNGFCPSFVVLEGAELRKPEALSAEIPKASEPLNKVKLDTPYAIALTGVGGTGVVTIGALLGMAAHIDNRGCGIIDMAGLAQKGGAVVSHIKLGATPEDIKAIRIADGGTDLLLGCDELVSTEDHILKTLDKSRSAMVVNTVERLTGEFTRNPDFKLPASLMQHKLKDAVADDRAHFVNAAGLATALLGDSIGGNLFVLGVAYQQGLIPLSAESILKAIELNGVAVDFNQRAFAWGRAWVEQPEAVEQKASEAEKIAPDTTGEEQGIDQLIANREQRLQQYQNKRYANRYRKFVDSVRATDQTEEQQLTFAVTRNLYKLMAYKDEYEVARLYADDSFAETLQKKFTGDYTVKLQLAPPLLSQTDKATGKPRKREFGPWMLKLFAGLSRLKFLRGTPLDVFGYTAERRMERQLINDYKQTVTDTIARCDSLQSSPTYKSDLQTLVKIASLPEGIRGFGHVKLANAKKIALQQVDLLGGIGKEPMPDEIKVELPTPVRTAS